MPNYFRPIEIPEYCFLSEAVEWLAIGEVPEAKWEFPERASQSGAYPTEVEYRFAWELMPGNFQPQSELTFFDKDHFNFAGVPVRRGYTQAAETCTANNLEWREKQIEKLRGASPLLIPDHEGKQYDLNTLLIKDHRSLLRQFADELKLVKAVNADFAPIFDAAWARIFSAVVDGSLEIEGIDFERWVDLKERQRYEDAGKFQQLPPAALTLATDWSSNSVLYEYRDFVSLRCRTDTIAEMIAPRLMQSQPVEARRCGGFLWSSEPAQTQKIKRGRAPALDWSVLRDRLLQQGQAGLLPVSKESCIYDLIAFAENEMGKSVGRTTVQERLKSELKVFYSN